MTNRKLRKALLHKLGITPQALSQRVGRMKTQHGPMSTEEATYVIAHLEKIDISRYLDAGTVDTVRRLVPKSSHPAPAAKPTTKSVKQTNVTIGAALRLIDPLLPNAIISDAKAMAEKVYPLVYIFENSIREVIRRVLYAAYGKDWWDTAVPADIVKAIAPRLRKEESAHWHGKRGAHAIFYSDTDHLRLIISAQWAHFAPLFPNEAWVTQRITEINVSRRVIAHCNPLSEADRKRLEVYFGDWQRQIDGVKGRIP